MVLRMAPTLSIRTAVLADARRLAELSAVLGYPIARDRLADTLGRLLTRESEVVLVAELGPGLIIGWLHGAEQELLECGRRCEICGLVIDGAHRGHGAGRRLVQAAEAWAAARGLAEVSVRSNVLRSESHPFYERLGFVREKTQHAYRKSLA
jgi:GNAT superfamily N-acetyltransferase